MSERENILARVKEALRVVAPAPGSHDGSPTPALSTRDLRQVLPFSGDSFEQRLELFKTNATTLKADFRLVKNVPAAVALLQQLRDTEGWKKAAFHSGELTEAVCPSLALPCCRTDAAYNVRELESCSVGVTECDALVAQTGSVLLTSRSAGGRALSVLPPHHVVLARAVQLLVDLPEALAFLKKKYAPDYPSFISFITGPSRTGDIERILVLGAHGPKKLTIILLQTA